MACACTHDIVPCGAAVIDQDCAWTTTQCCFPLCIRLQFKSYCKLRLFKHYIVRVISSVQSQHTCSEMRYCNHRDHCPWRFFTARQDNKHTLVGLSRPPGKCRSTEQFSQTISAVKTGLQVESMLVRKRLRHRYLALTMVCAKTGQLSTIVSSFDSKAMA